MRGSVRANFLAVDDPSAGLYPANTLQPPKMSREGVPFVAISGRDGVDILDPTNINFDGLAPGPTDQFLPCAAFPFVFDPVANDWNRLRELLSDADAQVAAQIGLLGAVARIQGFNGATFDRLRTASAPNLAAASGVGATLAAAPGNWSINHTPAANTQATITRAAGAAGVRHVCTSISATFNALTAAVETTVMLNLRDGASGAGTILWSVRLHAIPAGTTGISLGGLAIVGAAATAMTLEFAATGGASTFQSVALTGYDAS